MMCSKQIFETLRAELCREMLLEAKDRSSEFKRFTLSHFLEHGRRTEDHDLWRECYMLAETIAIMDRRLLARNPQIESRLRFKRALEELSADQEDERFRIMHNYQQAVGEDGRTQEEIDDEQSIVYPETDRLTLELQAAENYLYTRWGIKRRIRDHSAREGVATERTGENTSPILNYKEIQQELQKSHNTYAAVKQAVSRAISDGQKTGEPPWPMGGCAEGYRIMTAEPKRGSNHPTPSACTYQKIPQESED